jgi:hypothetical protein
MGFFRFRKSVKIAPGVRLNFSRSGVSTTVGVRGLSVNTGRRGTYLNAGIPGTGIRSRSRLGGGGGRRGGSAALGGGGNALAGCMGCSGIGFMLLLFVGFCGSIASHSGGGPDVGSYPLSTVDSSYARQQRETLYARGPVNVRSGAGTAHAIAQTLARGDRIEVAAPDSHGWAAAYDWAGRRLGYVHLPNTHLRPSPPSTDSDERPRSRRHSGSGARSAESTQGASSGATARCRDGSLSFSAHHRGTCSHHHGVAEWF